MRHDPAIAAIVIMLRELKMFGMAQAVSELAEQGAPAFEAAQPMLSQLLKAETAEREVRAGRRDNAEKMVQLMDELLVFSRVGRPQPTAGGEEEPKDDADQLLI